MKEWKTYTLEEICTGKGAYGIGASAVTYDSSKYTYLRITDINDDGTLNKGELKSVDDEEAYKYILQKNDIVFARTGNSTGRSYFYDGTDGELVYAGFLIKFSLDLSKVNPRIMKYYTHSRDYYDWVKSFDTGGTRGNINAKTYGLMPITLPPREVQDKIVEVLKSIDEKIDLNKRINDNLEQQAQALYKSWFVDFEPFKDGKFEESEIGLIPEGWCVGKAEDFYEINIGKTPPRKEHEWFTLDKSQNIWVSISDLGSDGRFLFDSSEYLTDKAIQKHNIVLVPEDTVLLSFKLTIGRVGIAGTQLTTNEAIARFITNSVNREYTYFLLKNFNYSKLGSTSSIATAVNSKIIKAMVVLMPSNECLLNFKKLVGPIIDGIKKNEEEILRLTELRDTLLPKLMSGELKINEIDC